MGNKDKLNKLLKELYWVKNLSSRQIAKILKIEKTSVLRFMKKCNIPRRNIGHKIPKITKKYLFNLYITKQYSTHYIARICKCSQSFILKLLRKYTIEIRQKEAARLMVMHSDNFRNNISKISKTRWQDTNYQRKMSLIRGGTGVPYENSEYPKEFYEIREDILKRDDYTCQNCNSKKELSVHHIDYNKENNIKTNLITLCNKCNTVANFDKKYYQKYYQEVILCLKP